VTCRYRGSRKVHVPPRRSGTATAVADVSSSRISTASDVRNGGRRTDIHQSTALRRARADLARFEGGEVSSEKKGDGRRKVLTWGTSWSARITVIGPTWGCVAAGLVAAVEEWNATSQAGGVLVDRRSPARSSA
jgi:hypothetical protein